jgi:death-on-curing family protein
MPTGIHFANWPNEGTGLAPPVSRHRSPQHADRPIALARPANLYRYESCSDISQLAAAYAGGIIQNHPFVDGNKRTGFMAAFMFLDLNGKTLHADEVTTTAMTVSLAASDIDEREYAIWLAENIGTK